MRNEEFENLCQATASGTERKVKHIVTHQIGKVLSCGPEDFIEVEVEGGEKKSWSKDNVKLLQ